MAEDAKPNGQAATANFALTIGHDTASVTLDFGREVGWIKMSPAQALALAALLESHARDAEIGV